MKPRPEGVESMWAMVRWKNGRLYYRRGLPPGLLALFCRIGLHFMVEDFVGDRYACRCRKQQLWNEHLRHGPRTERITVNEGTRVYWVPQADPEHPPVAAVDGAFGIDLSTYIVTEPTPVPAALSSEAVDEMIASLLVSTADSFGVPAHMVADDITGAIRLSDPTPRLVPDSGDLLDRIDRAVDGLCPCGAEPREGSAYCSYDCEPNIIGRDTDTRQHGAYATPMRWRPDLVTDAPDDDLTPIGVGERLDVGGSLFRSAFRRADGRVHLRLDDGRRYVGCDVAEEFQDPDGYTAAWGRLERELINPRHVVAGEPDPDSFIESVLPGLLDFEERLGVARRQAYAGQLLTDEDVEILRDPFAARMSAAVEAAQENWRALWDVVRAGGPDPRTAETPFASPPAPDWSMLGPFVDEMPEIVTSPYLPPGTAAVVFDPIALHPDHPEYRSVSRRTVIIRE